MMILKVVFIHYLMDKYLQMENGRVFTMGMDLQELRWTLMVVVKKTYFLCIQKHQQTITKQMQIW